MKKLVCLAIALVMVLGLAACASAEFKFERKIDLVCPWGVGGGADSTLRPQEAIDTLVAAIEEAKQSDTWKEFTHNAAYDERPIPAPGEETAEFCHNEYKDLHDYMVEQGTLVKDYDDLK